MTLAPRTRPRALAPILAAPLSIALVTGCVSQERADDLRHVVRTSNEQVEVLRGELEEKDARIAELDQQLEGARAGSDTRTRTLTSDLDATRADRDRLRADLTRLENQVRAMGEGGGNRGVLDPRLDADLRGLAAREPDAMTYDPARGMIQLQSDLTFATGSTDLRPEALASLRSLANAINSDAARDYELRIVGHTDNVPVRNPANVAKYEDNFGLSAFRAKSVMQALASAGVEESRITIAGRGDTDPVAPNGPKGNPANRRVELFLVANPNDTAPTATPPTLPQAEPDK